MSAILRATRSPLNETGWSFARCQRWIPTVGLWLISQSNAAVAQTNATNAAVQNQLVFVLLFWFVAVVIGLIVLFIPAMIAFRRRHPNRWAIAVICFAFGGTIIGWFGALVWALQAIHISPTGSNGGESGLNIFVNDPMIVRGEPYHADKQSMVAPPTSIEELSSRLTRLKSLADQGAISQDEHHALRQSILAAL